MERFFRTRVYLYAAAAMCLNISGCKTRAESASVKNANDQGAATSTQTLSHATRIAAGDAHTCALLDSGQIACWGSNTLGQLGIGDTGVDAGPEKCHAALGHDGLPPPEFACSRQPLAVKWPSEAGRPIDLTGAGDHTCALDDKGGIWCWGDNDNEQLGSPSGTHCKLSPTAQLQKCTRSPQRVIKIAATVRKIQTSRSHTCALMEGSSMFCWGSDVQGQLGAADTLVGKSVMEPQAVMDLPGPAEDFIVNGTSTCANVQADGGPKIACWGENSDSAAPIHDLGSLPTGQCSGIIPCNRKPTIATELPAGALAYTVRPSCVFLATTANGALRSVNWPLFSTGGEGGLPC